MWAMQVVASSIVETAGRSIFLRRRRGALGYWYGANAVAAVTRRASKASADATISPSNASASATPLSFSRTARVLALRRPGVRPFGFPL